MLCHIGIVAYELHLPATSCVHPIIHVPLLRAFKGPHVTTELNSPSHTNSNSQRPSNPQLIHSPNSQRLSNSQPIHSPNSKGLSNPQLMHSPNSKGLSNP